MNTQTTEQRGITRYGINLTSLRRTILKSSVLTASLVVLGTGAALANDTQSQTCSASRGQYKSSVAYCSSHLGRSDNRIVRRQRSRRGASYNGQPKVTIATYGHFYSGQTDDRIVTRPRKITNRGPGLLVGAKRREVRFRIKLAD